MIVRSFLKWFDNSPVAERIDAVQHMARAYLDGHLGSDTKEEAEAALTLVLDDPAPIVRRALAWEFASCDAAPRHIIVGLAHDRSEVGGLVLARSPLLRDPDLIDCARVGDTLTQTAIAVRPSVSLAVSNALAAVAERDPLMALLRNPGAEISSSSFAVMFERHGQDPVFREALRPRVDLPAPVRQALLAAMSEDLLKFVGKTGWIGRGRAERVIVENKDVATITLASRAEDLGALVDHLRNTAQLTPVLLLRSLLCGETGLFGASLVSLAGADPRRVAAAMDARGQGPLAAFYHKAGLPAGLLPAFAAALAAIRELDLPDIGDEPELRRPIIQRALVACLEQEEAEMQTMLALLRRFDAEAARRDARVLANEMMTRRNPATLESHPAVDLLALASALEIDLMDTRMSPECALECPLETAFATEESSFFEQFESNSVDRRTPLPTAFDDVEPLPSAFEEIVAEAPEVSEADIQDAIAEIYAGVSETAEADLTALRVNKTGVRPLDESFFASWEIRSKAA